MGFPTVARIKDLFVEEIFFIGLMGSMGFLLYMFDCTLDFILVSTQVSTIFTFAFILAKTTIVKTRAVHFQTMGFGTCTWDKGRCLLTRTGTWLAFLLPIWFRLRFRILRLFSFFHLCWSCFLGRSSLHWREWLYWCYCLHSLFSLKKSCKLAITRNLRYGLMIIEWWRRWHPEGLINQTRLPNKHTENITNITIFQLRGLPERLGSNDVTQLSTLS